MNKALKEYVDVSYLAEKRKNPLVKFQVFGFINMRRVFWRYVSCTCCIYCEKENVYYNSFGWTKNIYSDIKELCVRRSIFNKKIIRLKIKTDKAHRITIYKDDSLSTEITGNQPQHCQELIDMLAKKCIANNGKVKDKTQNL